jgi:predicted permease
VSRRDRMMDSLDQDIRDHIEIETRDNIERGMPAEEARHAAILKFGNVTKVKEDTRDVWIWAWLEQLLQDVGYGLRGLRKSPGFTIVAVLTLALGIGANAAIFTLTYAVILKNLPVPNPQQLVRYSFRSSTQDLGLSGPLYDALRKHEDAPRDILAWAAANLAVQRDGAVTNVSGALISGNGFQVLELRPFLGRFFSEEADRKGGGPNGYKAVLSYAYWKQHLHGDPNVVGRSLIINGKTTTVVGVLPSGFEGLVVGQRTDMVLPLAFEEVLNAPQSMRQAAGSFWLTVIGRLKPGSSLRTAQANLTATAAQVREEADPRHKFLTGFFAAFRMDVESARSGRSFLRIAYGQPLIVLEILVGLVLLLCCANTALLVLARVSNRLREFAVRSALGAPRRRMFQQVMSEIALLAFGGLVAGVALGWAAARSLTSMLAAIGQPPPLDSTPQTAVLAFTATISVFSALAAGTWPAIRASRVAPILRLKEGGTTSTSKGLGKWIVPVQVAVSVVLVAAASLLGASFFRLLQEDSGFRSHGAILAEVDLSANKVTQTVATRDAQQIVDAIESTAGVDSAAVMSSPPLHGWWSAAHYYSLDQKGTRHVDMQTWPEEVSLDYFATIGTPILKGRAFTRSDSSGAPVCVLSASAAQNFFPGEQAVGRFVYAGEEDPTQDGKGRVDPRNICQVVGVAADARFQSLREPAQRAIYHLIPQEEVGADFFVIVYSRQSQIATAAILEAVRNVAPGAPQPTVFTFDELLATHLRQERMLTALSACFACVALLLTALGLYGLLSRTVVLRTKEIGLRLALGAQPRDALSLVLRDGLRLVIVGTVFGLIAAFGIAKILNSLLLGVQSNGPLLIIAATLALFLVALGASCIPAVRAARVDPMEALRYE